MLLQTRNDQPRDPDELDTMLAKFADSHSPLQKLFYYNRLSSAVKTCIQELFSGKNSKKRSFLSRGSEVDYNVPVTFLASELPGSAESKLKATMYLVLQTLCYQSLQELSPMDNTTKVFSVNAKDKDGSALDITGIYTTLQILLRKRVIDANLLRFEEGLAQSHADFLYHLLCKSMIPFDHAGFMTDRSILIDELAQHCIGFSYLFPQMHFKNAYDDNHVRAAFNELNSRAEQLEDIQFDLTGLRVQQQMTRISETAHMLTRYLDHWGLSLSKEPDHNTNGSRVAVTEAGGGRRTINCGDLIMATNINQLRGGIPHARFINGQRIIIEYLPAFQLDSLYAARSHAVAPFVEQLQQELANICAKLEVTISEDCEQNGDICALDKYRDQADMRIFTNIYQQIDPRSKFYLMLLVDNSCSININKQRIMADILCLLVNLIMERPEMFTHVAAYSQHSTGNRNVTMRQLLDAPASEIADPSSIVHLTSSGVNYDAYAAAELVASHREDFGEARPLLILIGDSWPVSHSGEDVKNESRNIYRTIKEENPRLITFYFSVDQCHEPTDFYDYVVKMNTTFSGLSDFIEGFTRMVEKVLLRGEGVT